VAQFVEKNKDVIVDHVIALHNGIEYELILRSTPDRYQRDLREFEKVIAGWKLTTSHPKRVRVPVAQAQR
jgi:hypothetical protein